MSKFPDTEIGQAARKAWTYYRLEYFHIWYDSLNEWTQHPDGSWTFRRRKDKHICWMEYGDAGCLCVHCDAKRMEIK